MNKQIIHDALVLTAFTLVIGVILGAVYGITKTPIDKANEQTKKEAYQAVFADASGFNQQEYDADAADKMVADAGYDDTIDDVEQAVDKDGNALGYVITVTAKDGSQGSITFSGRQCVASTVYDIHHRNRKTVPGSPAKKTVKRNIQ